MSQTGTGRRRAPRSLTPWIAGLAALAAIGALLWAVLGGTGDRDAAGDEPSSRSRRIATAGAVEAVPLAPELDPGPVGAPGGPGSVVTEGPTTVAVAEPGASGGPRRVNRARRAARSEPRRSASPTYRAIGPRASEAPAAPAPAAPPAED